MPPSLSSRQVIAKQQQLLTTRKSALALQRKSHETSRRVKTLEVLTKAQVKTLRSQQRQCENTKQKEKKLVNELKPYLKAKALGYKHKILKKVNVSQKLLRRLRKSMQEDINRVDSRTKKRDWLQYAVKSLTQKNALHMQGSKSNTCVSSSFANCMQLFCHRIGFTLNMSRLIEILLHQLYHTESETNGNGPLEVKQIVTAFNAAVGQKMYPIVQDTNQSIPGYAPLTDFYLACSVEVLFHNTQPYKGVKELLKTPCTRDQIYIAIQEEGDRRHAVVVQGTGSERVMKYDPHADKRDAIEVDVKKLKYIYKLLIEKVEIVALRNETWHEVKVPSSMGWEGQKKGQPI